MSVTEAYQRLLTERGYASDPAQLRAVAALQRCQDEWADYKARRSNAVTKLLRRPPIPRGVYMFGGVGRGKSFLMDCFFNEVPLQRKTRLHFHEFMREVHRELQDLKGTVDPLDELGKRIARRFRLICFDEFHVADVTDAMILHRLLAALFANRVSIVTTSNFHPDDLYPNGLHRDRIQPAIDLLKARLEVVNVDNGVDYRRRLFEQVELYHTPLGAAADKAMEAAFERLAEARDDKPLLHIENREIRARRRAGGVVWFDFKHAVRRPALAERLPRACQPVPYAAAVGRPGDVAAPCFGGAAVHLARRRAVRPAREADHVRAGTARGALHGWAAGPRVPSYRLEARRDAVGRIPGVGAARRGYFAHMKRRFASRIGVGALLAVCTVAVAEAPDSAAAHERIRAQRGAAEALYRERVKECNTKFVVTACVDAARAQRHETLARLDREQAELDDAKRRERSVQRSDAIAAKASDADARRRDDDAGSRRNAAPGHAASAPRPGQPRASAPQRSAKAANSPAQRAAQEERATNAFEAKQVQAELHRQEVARRNAEHARKTNPAAPLPVPAPSTPAAPGGSAPATGPRGTSPR